MKYGHEYDMNMDMGHDKILKIECGDTTNNIYYYYIFSYINL